jgi:hypothetical protein
VNHDAVDVTRLFNLILICQMRSSAWIGRKYGLGPVGFSGFPRGELPLVMSSIAARVRWWRDHSDTLSMNGERSRSSIVWPVYRRGWARAETRPR